WCSCSRTSASEQERPRPGTSPSGWALSYQPLLFTPPLSDLGAALLADANLLAVGLHLVGGAGGLAALGTHALHLAGVDGGLLLQDAALVALLAGLGVAGDHVDLLHDHLALLGHNLQDLALLALVLAGQ